MNPIDFPQRTAVLKPPVGMSDGGCGALPVFRDAFQVISCWQPTEEERAAIAAGAPVWLGVLGQGQPPVWLATMTPFVAAEALDPS